MAQHEEWVVWLAKVGYGLDWRSDADPPCTLEELASAHMKEPHMEGCTLEEAMWCITEETGEWRASQTTPRV